MEPDQYRCEMCGGVYAKGWSDDAALAELGVVFPDTPREQCRIVCDQCYRLVMGHPVTLH